MRDRGPVSVPDAIRRAALFPEADLPDPPAEYPSRRVLVEGVFVRLPVGLPVALVSPERIEEPRLEQVVDGVRQFLRAEGRTNAVWFVQEEETFPNDLAERLQTLGMRSSDLPGFEPRDAAMVIIEAPPPGPAEVVVRRPANFEEFLAAHLIMGDSFGVDDPTRRLFEERAERLWSFEYASGTGATFLALLDGEVVGFAVAQFGRTAVFMSGGGTRPDRRGRGAYRALVRARWDAAVEWGTPALTVGAGSMSRPILERLGFSTVGWADCLLDELSR
jgi:hypothetical protein